MAENNLQELKNQLLKAKDDVEKELKGLGEVVDFGSDAEGEVAEEEADEAEEFSQNAGITATLKVRLVDIQKALEKMERGEYGKCEECVMDIEPEVLNAAPESRLCKTHKK